MKKKLLMLNLVVVVLGFAAAFLFASFQVQHQYQEEFSGRLSTALSVLSTQEEALQLHPGEIAEAVGQQLREAGEEMRISVISPGGKVLGDSRQEEIEEDHSNRPEVQEAIASGHGSDTRVSGTLHESFYYEAVVLDNGLILRAAIPTSDMDLELLRLWKSAGLSMVLGILVVCLATWLLASVAMRPLNALTEAAERISNGEYESRVSVRSGDEVGRLAVAFNRMAENTERSMEAMESSKNQLKGLLEGMDDGVLAIDRKDRVLFYNDRARALTNGAVMEVGGCLDGSLLLTHIGHLMHRAMDTGEAMHENLSGSSEDQKLTVYTACVDRGQTALAVISDVTRMKQLEKLRSEFVSNVTHELKTPLTAIRGSIELLKSADRDESTRAYFYDVLDIETERLKRLIDDMLALSQIENAKDDPAARPCNVEESVREVVERLSATAAACGVQVNYEVDSALTVRCSPMRLQQMLLNLVENGIKYNHPGGSVDVEGTEQRDMVILRVRDTGIGIAPQHIGRLFERFYRVDTSRSREVGGTGLGLSIVKHLAVLYGGNVGVESTPGKGTTFLIRLPVCSGNQAESN